MLQYIQLFCLDLCIVGGFHFHLTLRGLAGNLRACCGSLVCILEFNDQTVGAWADEGAVPIYDFLIYVDFYLSAVDCSPVGFNLV